MQWIKCSDRWPEDQQKVICFIKNFNQPSKSYISINYYYSDEEFKDRFQEGWDVTHWMPLPEPPEEENAVE